MKTPPLARALRPIALVVFAGVVAIAAQSTAAQSTGPAFEVASVRRNMTDTRAMTLLPVGMRPPAGMQFTARAVTLRDLLRFAFQFRQVAQDQVVGGPAWINTARFDIAAKASKEFAREADGSSPELYAMVRALIEDRFKVRAHVEQRELPIYGLILSRNDGSLGPQLTRATVPCERPAAAGVPAPAGLTRRCQTSLGQGVVNAQGMTMATFAQLIGNLPAVGRTVRDQTGLTGEFDFRLEDVAQYLPTGPNSVTANPAAENTATIFTVIQEQLGLKLDSQRGPVDILVVDHVEPPTEN